MDKLLVISVEYIFAVVKGSLSAKRPHFMVARFLVLVYKRTSMVDDTAWLPDYVSTMRFVSTGSQWLVLHVCVQHHGNTPVYINQPVTLEWRADTTDETHADAMNNIGAVLSALPPLDRARVAETFGLLRQAPEAFKMLARAGSRGSNDVNIEAVDSAVEGLYRRTLEAESTHRWALNNLGLHLHWRSRNEEVRCYCCRRKRARKLYES